MSDDDTIQDEPSAESLAEMPAVDFSRAIRPNKFAALRGEFKHAVFLDVAAALRRSRTFVGAVQADFLRQMKAYWFET